MHVTRLPDLPSIRTTLIAALLALAVAAGATWIAGGGLTDARTSTPAADAAAPAATAPTVRPPLAPEPAWKADPLAPVTLR